ncbi:MAG: hypothetical protein PVH62_02910, partial [Anaerolineae bacterium]
MRRLSLVLLLSLTMLLGITGQAQAVNATPQTGTVVHVLYFYQANCPHCQAVEEEVLAPLQAQYGEQLQIRKLLTTDSSTN